MRKLMLRAGFAAILGWAAAFIFFGTRRWFCFPWDGQCGANFVRTLETAVLFLWVSDREALFAALLAVGAAAVGAYFLNLQVRQADAHERNRNSRDYRAAKAMAPLVLTEICDFADETAEQWLRLKSHIELLGLAPDHPSLRLEFTRVSPESLDDMREIIRFAPIQEASYYEALIGSIQVRVARSRDAAKYANDEGRRPSPAYIVSEILETAELYARAGGLFDFARNEGPFPDRQKPERDQVRSALRSLRLYDGVDAEVWETFERRYPAT